MEGSRRHVENFCIFPKKNGKSWLGFKEEGAMIGLEFQKHYFTSVLEVNLGETRLDTVDQLQGSCSDPQSEDGNLN